MIINGADVDFTMLPEEFARAIAGDDVEEPPEDSPRTDDEGAAQ